MALQGIELSQEQVNIAKAFLDIKNNGSPNSIQSQSKSKNTKTQEELKSSNDKMIYNSGSTSRDDLNTEQVVSDQLDRLDTQPLASPNNSMPNTTPMSTDSGAIKIEISGQAEEPLSHSQYNFKPPNKHGSANNALQIDSNNLQSPTSVDSATGGIQKGSMSLSSSTSKDNNQPLMLGMAPGDRLEDQSLVHSPDITFGVLQRSSIGCEPQETTANTSAGLGPQQLPDEDQQMEEDKRLKPSAGVTSLTALNDFKEIADQHPQDSDKKV